MAKDSFLAPAPRAIAPAEGETPVEAIEEISAEPAVEPVETPVETPAAEVASAPAADVVVAAEPASVKEVAVEPAVEAAETAEAVEEEPTVADAGEWDVCGRGGGGASDLFLRKASCRLPYRGQEEGRMMVS